MDNQKLLDLIFFASERCRMLTPRLDALHSNVSQNKDCSISELAFMSSIEEELHKSLILIKENIDE